MSEQNNPTPQYNLSPSLINRLAFKIQHFNEQKKVMEEFSRIMSERADLEAYYCTNLQKTSEQLLKLSQFSQIEPNMGQLILSLRSSILTHSEQAEIFAQNLKKDILHRMYKIRQEQFDQLNKTSNNVKTFENNLQKQIQSLEQSKKLYYKSHKELNMIEKSIEIMNEQQNQNLQQQQKEIKVKQQLYKKQEKLVQEKQGNLEKLQSTTQEYNMFLDNYFQQIGEITEFHKIEEEERIGFLKDSVMKYIIFQISYIKNIEYDFNQISKKVEDYQRQSPLQYYQDRDASQLLSKLNFEDFKFFIENEYQSHAIDKKLQNKDIVYYPDIDVTKIQSQVTNTFSKFKSMFSQKFGGSQNNNSQNQVQPGQYVFEFDNDQNSEQVQIQPSQGREERPQQLVDLRPVQQGIIDLSLEQQKQNQLQQQQNQQPKVAQTAQTYTIQPPQQQQYQQQQQQQQQPNKVQQTRTRQPIFSKQVPQNPGIALPFKSEDSTEQQPQPEIINPIPTQNQIQIQVQEQSQIPSLTQSQNQGQIQKQEQFVNLNQVQSQIVEKTQESSQNQNQNSIQNQNQNQNQPSNQGQTSFKKSIISFQ